MNRPRQLAANSAPGKSKAWVALGVRGNVFRPIKIATRPKGMLRANSQLHGPIARMPEATVGPSVNAVATTSALYPKPRPCERPVSRLGSDQAHAQANDANVNSKRPPR